MGRVKAGTQAGWAGRLCVAVAEMASLGAMDDVLPRWRGSQGCSAPGPAQELQSGAQEQALGSPGTVAILLGAGSTVSLAWRVGGGVLTWFHLQHMKDLSDRSA